MSNDRSRFFDPETKKFGELEREISTMYRDVQQKMLAHDGATQQYKQRQEQYFLKVFSNVMERLSDQLKAAQERYRNIDMEIQKDERVIRLQKEVFYFREQCVILTEKMHELEAQVRRMSANNIRMSEEKKDQYTLLLKKTKEKQALMKRIERISSDEHPLKTSRRLGDERIPNETIGSMSRTTNNLRPKNARILTKNQTTKPSEEEAKTARDSSKDRPQPDNQLLEIWKQCVRQARRSNEFMKFLAKQTKLSTLSKFFSVDLVINFVEQRLSNQKCCNSTKCKNNAKRPLTEEYVKSRIFNPIKDEVREGYHPYFVPTAKSSIHQHAKTTAAQQKLAKQKSYSAYRKHRESLPLPIPGLFDLTLQEHNKHTPI